MNKKLSKFLICIVILCGMVCVSYAQQIKTQTVHGIVIDRDSKFTLPYVNIAILNKENTLGTISNINGVFVLENVPIGRQTIQISCIGYKTIILSLKSAS